MEGQIDAIRCWLEGFKTVVAPQGTSFQDSQAMLLKKSNPKGVVCLLDGDEAGQNAAFKYIATFLKAGIDARFSSLPTGKDPDQILLEKGSEGLQNILDQGISSIEFAVKHKLKGKRNPQASEIRVVSDLIFSSISEVDSLIMRDIYLKELSKHLKISFQTISEEFSHFVRSKKPKYKAISPNTDEISSKKDSPRLTTAEDDLLFCLLHDDRVASPLAQIFDPTWLNLDIPAGRILAKIMAETKADGPIESNRMEEFLEDDMEKRLINKTSFRKFRCLMKIPSFNIPTNACLPYLSDRLNRKKKKSSITSIMQAEKMNPSIPSGNDFIVLESIAKARLN